MYSYIEHNNYIDAEQEGFRKFYSAPIVLLRLVQNILMGLRRILAL